ncbi:GNAT family N-acetyltransferase [Kovacikia minuta CCNUW1]|uniref:GNAT family N-acetyltransferase n=1 Tax=Kovacikia minuta TaxID=2931930 RepID=UPI001CD02F30|nr:GNAT family N-acetyltransferase [Kovacikia minuta]UBF25412.1 GNAT family N-acetyltransferase [Kovacikia minuta CCNUW1]
MNTRLSSLPSGCSLRPAAATDAWSIRKLVLSAKLDPTQLRWSQFWVIEHEKQVIACGQLRSFPKAQELGSLVVAPQWRGQGLGTYLTQHLIQQATQPLYLECLGKKLVQFYTRLGFVPVPWQELPPSLKRKFGLSAIAASLFRLPITLMRYLDSV